MNKQRAINLIILLVLLILLPSIAYLTSIDNDTCTMHCQRVIHDTAWDECMLQCLKENAQ